MIERWVRGLNPWPSACTPWKGKILKTWDADVVNEEYPGSCGEVIAVEKDSILMKTEKGALTLKSLQLEGKKRMDTNAFLRGYQIEKGTILCAISSGRVPEA